MGFFSAKVIFETKLLATVLVTLACCLAILKHDRCTVTTINVKIKS